MLSGLAEICALMLDENTDKGHNKILFCCINNLRFVRPMSCPDLSKVLRVIMLK